MTVRFNHQNTVSKIIIISHWALTCKHHSAYMTIIALPPSPPPVALKDTNSKRHTSEGKLGFVQVLKTQCEKFILHVVYEAWAYVLPWAPVLLELLISRLWVLGETTSPPYLKGQQHKHLETAWVGPWSRTLTGFTILLSASPSDTGHYYYSLDHRSPTSGIQRLMIWEREADQ